MLRHIASWDIEAWMPGLQRYGEISSASNCTDYQSRRLNIRYRQACRHSLTFSQRRSCVLRLCRVQRRRALHRLTDTVLCRPSAKDAHTNGNGAEDGKAKKAKKVQTEFVHTLNATACAVPRMVVAILENFQQEDGTVRIPEILQGFMGGQKFIEPPLQ